MDGGGSDGGNSDDGDEWTLVVSCDNSGGKRTPVASRTVVDWTFSGWWVRWWRHLLTAVMVAGVDSSGESDSAGGSGPLRTVKVGVMKVAWWW